MASAAEQMTAGLSLGAFSEATDLKKRIWFPLWALIVFRLGTSIPVPGINATVMAHLMTQNGGGVLGMFNMFTGGALGRMTIFDHSTGSRCACGCTAAPHSGSLHPG